METVSWVRRLVPEVEPEPEPEPLPLPEPEPESGVILPVTVPEVLMPASSPEAKTLSRLVKLMANTARIARTVIKLAGKSFHWWPPK